MFNKEPKVSEVTLSKDYSFMYENFVIATQSAVYLLLKKSGESVYALRFDSPSCRYGGPNDENHSGHSLAKYGLGIYGVYEVEHSPWIAEMKNANRAHPGHSDSLFDGKRHYIVCFKDVKFESVCREMSEVTLGNDDIDALIRGELDSLEC